MSPTWIWMQLAIVIFVLIGMVIAIHDAPMAVGTTARAVLDALAARVGAELQRSSWDRLRRAEDERFRLATQASGMAVWDWDIVTDELVWKGAVEAVFGDAAIRAARNPSAFWERVHPEDLPRARARFQQALDGQDSIYLEPDFEVGPGPKYHVYLVPKASIRASGDLRDQMFVDLGRLRSFKGSQRYTIPAGVDLSKFESVIIWCEQFSVLISPADLKRR